eukprot:5142881-Prymnesium_polylepis.1
MRGYGCTDGWNHADQGLGQIGLLRIGDRSAVANRCSHLPTYYGLCDASLYADRAVVRDVHACWPEHHRSGGVVK